MKTKSFLLNLAISFLFLNLTAQISTSNGTINSTTNPSTGNVGIGTTTPDSKLEVVGDLKAIKGIFPGKELSGEIFTDHNDGIEKSIIFSAGKTVPGSLNKRLFTMHDLSMSSPYNYNAVLFHMRDRAGKERFSVQLYEGYGSSLELKDHNQSELFKVSGNSDEAYLQMPKPNSKIIIGGFSNNPIVGTHKFVVTGSSLIQGNIITDSSIGIGTGVTTPSAKLHIVDQGTSGETTLQLNNRIKFKGDGVVEWGASSNQGILSWDTGRAIIGAKEGQDLSLYANYSEKMRINQNGNIGIGTTTPNEKLQIGNSYTFHDGGHKVLGFMYGASGETDLSSTKYAAEIRFDPDLGNLRLGTSSSLTNTPTSHLIITKDGYVGIGTTDTKGFKLGVKGKIAATEVKIATYSNWWPDFVFKSNYSLPTLKEVEQHIKEKGHLKDIPSAEEVKKDGFFLGEMDSKLLKKIEELTLYTIEQQKEIEILKKENKELQSLSKRLAKIELLLSNKK